MRREATRAASGWSFAHGSSYLSLDREARFLVSAHYHGGEVDVYTLDENGDLGKRVTALDEGRTFAHSALLTPDRRFLYVPYVKDQNALFSVSLRCRDRHADSAGSEGRWSAGEDGTTPHRSPPFKTDRLLQQ